MNHSVEDELGKMLFRVLVNSDLNVLFGGLMDIFRETVLHESCQYMSLVNFGKNFSLIGVIKREIWHFW